jgi:hypothetical protein
MAEIKKYIWVFPLIGAIVAFISLVTPATSMNFVGILRADLWLWDLYINNASGITRIDFITDPFVLIPSIITTALISISSILLLIGSIQTKRRSNKLKTIRNISIISGALILFAEILWLIMVPMFFPMTSYWDWFLSTYLTPYTFWSIFLLFFSYPLHQAGFGIIGGFLAMALAFGGAGVAEYHSKERPIKIPEKMKTTLQTDEPKSSKTLKFKLCPECGSKIEDSNEKSCLECGFEFKGS